MQRQTKISAACAGKPPIPVIPRGCEQNGCRGIDGEGDVQNPSGREAAQEPAVDLGGADQATGVGAEQETEVLGGNAVQFDEDERGTRDVGEVDSGNAPQGYGIPQILAIAEKMAVDGDHFGEAAANAPLFWERFGEAERYRGEGKQSKDSEKDEDTPPAGNQEELPSRDGRQDRRGAHDQHEKRKHPGRFGGIVEVAHHGPRYHHAGPAANRHHHAPEQESLTRLDAGAPDRRGDIQRQSPESGMRLPHRSASGP